MQSATSFFNRALFRKNLQRFWPLWFGYTLLWLLILPLPLLNELADYHGVPTVADASYYLLQIGAYGGLVMGAVFGIFFAMAMFAYLTNPRATQGFHSMPVRRETLYATNYLAGLACMVSSIVLAFALAGVTAALFDALDLAAFGTACLAAVLAVVFFYSFAVLCMMFTGQILAAPVFYGILNFVAVGMEYLVRNFAGTFLYGYSGYMAPETFTILSPIWRLEQALSVRSAPDADLLLSDGTRQIVSSGGYVLYGMEWLGIYAAVGIVFALLGLLVYRKRPSEVSGSIVTVAWARPVFKYGVALCAAFSVGQLVYYLIFGINLTSGEYSLAGTIACMLFAGLLGYFAAEMLIKKSFRVFRAGAKGAAIVALALVLLGVAMSFDLTGYEKRVPDESEIESVYYTFSGMTNVTTDDADTIRRLTAAHQAIVKNRNEQARIADAWDADTLSQSDHDDIEPFSLRLTYYLKDGSQLSRSYSLYLRRSDLTVPSSATARVNALYMCRESVLRRVLGYGCDHLGDTPRFLDSYCYYYDENSNTKDYALTAAQAEQVYAALMQDVQDSDNGGSDIFAVQEYQYDPPISFWLELYFESTNEKGRPEVYTLSPHVNGSTPNTLQVLSELLPELKSNTVTPPSDDGIHTLPATEDVSTEESVN